MTNKVLTPFEDRVFDLADKLALILIAKNKDYGDSYAKSVERYGQTVTLIRLADKFSRLETLILSGDAAEVEESIDDTLMDLAGYALLELERRERGNQEHVYKKPPYADLDD